MPTDLHSEDSPTIENNAQCSADERRCMSFPHNIPISIADSPCDVGQVTINTFPDDALLYVFDFYLARTSEVEAWHTLVHVCRRWRILVFGSPRRLNLRIKCTDKTPAVKEKLDVWPALPIVISGDFYSHTHSDNINAALEHRNRICQISICFVGQNDIIALLEDPFPILKDLHLETFGYPLLFDPNPSKFLGGPGSAHLLQSLILRDAKIPDLLKLLLATPNLVVLRLYKVRNFFPLDEVVTVLSSLTRLEILDLDIEFDFTHSDWENQSLTLLTHATLPSLTMLKVTGDIEFLEDLMARIYTPLLDHLYILFSLFQFDLDRTIVLDTPQLLWFISRTPKLQAPVGAYIAFNADEFWIVFLHSMRISHREVNLKISGVEPERQIPCVAQFFYHSPPFLLPLLEYLYICGGQRSQRNLTEHTRWLELLQPFTAVKNLYLTKEFAPHIAHALQELVGERVMEVLPSLENVFIRDFEPSGPVHQVTKEFVVARQLAGHPITISCWDLSTG